jgi:protein SCO1/2
MRLKNIKKTNKSGNNLLMSLFIFLSSCQFSGEETKERLPVLGLKEVIGEDSIYHRIADFKLVNQLGDTISQEEIEGKIYIADFFFTSCPTICPKMKRQMLRVYDAYKENDHIIILSHTIDPGHDSVKVLYDFANQLGINHHKWYFLTGQKDKIYELAQKSYMAVASEDSTAPGGYVHSGAFILVDTKRRIRGYYDGTSEDDVDQLIKDIKILLREEFEKP